ncbi:MAG: SRPBCC family protein [Acidimicrobiales bacterium]
MKHELHTEITIDASPEVVWDILTDLGRYPDWNPFVVSSEGAVEVGAELVNRMVAPGGRAMTIKPTVTAVEDGRVYEWLGHLGIPGVFDGRHRFEIEPTTTGTRFRQMEFFTGILVRPFRKMIDGSTRDGFIAFNDAMKARAEAT